MKHFPLLPSVSWLLASGFWLLSAATPPERTDQLFANWNQKNTPGCAVGVLQDSKPVYQKGYGMANLDHSVANTPQTEFYLGSTSKEFTAAAVLLLVEAGKLKLEDPIRKWIPQLPAYMQAITVRHLLEHTSGIRDYIGLWTLSGPPEDAPLSDSQVYYIITRQKALNFLPGDEFLYSNSGYFLLQTLLKVASYNQLPDFALENIFKPLGLGNTFYYSDRFGVLPRRATGYSPGRQGGYRINTATLDVVGDGGVFTNVEDGLRWLQTLENPQGKFKKVVEQMKTRARLNGGAYAEYGRGLMLKRYRGMDIISHVGGLRGYRSDMLLIPAKKLGVVCLCNTSDADPGRLARQVVDAWLGPLPEPVLPKLTEADLKRKVGDYRDSESGDYLQITYGQGRFMAFYQGFQLDLRPETPTLFRAESPLYIEIEFKDDKPYFMRVESESHRQVHMERVTLNRAKPANIHDFEGDYQCDEAQSHITVNIADGSLSLDQNDNSIATLEPMQPDRFRSTTLTVDFLRDGQKQVTGFRLNTGRVRGLVFQKIKP